MTDVEKLKAERARIEEWRKSNMDKLGTAEFRRSTLVYRMLADLIARHGGNATERTYVMRELTAIYEGRQDT